MWPNDFAPNLESFRLDVVTATVRRDVPPPEKRKAVETALELLNKALDDMLAKVEEGKHLDEQDAEALRQALEVGDRSLGYDESDFQRQRERDQAEREAYAAAYTGGATEARLDRRDRPAPQEETPATTGRGGRGREAPRETLRSHLRSFLAIAWSISMETSAPETPRHESVATA